MDRRVLDDRRRIGSAKAAINMYGERILEGSSSLKKPEMELPEKHTSRARELRESKRDMNRYKERRRTADAGKARAESELLEAKRTVRDLAALIEESNANLKVQMGDLEKLKKSSKRLNERLDVGVAESRQYTDVVKELESVKQELGKLKLDMAAVLEEKALAEKDIAGSISKLRSGMHSAEALKKEIEEVNEDNVLTELAQIEAVKEFGEVEAKREKEANQFSSSMEETRNKIKDVVDEIDRSKEIESKLEATLADADVLQHELKVAKEMDKKVRRNDSLTRLGDSFRKGKELEDSSLLSSIAEELATAKKELSSVKEEGFQFMASMDIIRSELQHVTNETARLNRAKEKADLTVQNLNSKLLRARAKLESATAVEEKAKSTLSNLSLTLQQLKTEVDVVRKEKKLVDQETDNTKVEIQETESQINLNEERLQAVYQELEAVKTSERLAIENLRNLMENTMRYRASASERSSAITISKLEYEYLTGHAAAVEEIADKKVASAQAWVEALKASEKEILMKIEMSNRGIKETRLQEEQEIYRTEKTKSAHRVVEGELITRRQKYGKDTEAENLQLALPRKPANPGALTPSRQGKHRSSASPGFRMTPRVTPRSSVAVRKKKGGPNIGKFFLGKKTSKNL